MGALPPFTIRRSWWPSMCAATSAALASPSIRYLPAETIRTYGSRIRFSSRASARGIRFSCA